jgi:hypothetical protein
MNIPKTSTIIILTAILLCTITITLIPTGQCTVTFTGKWGYFGWESGGEFYQPMGITIDTSGNVYVADSYNSRIQKFSSSGGFITAWGSAGTGNGQFVYPMGVTIDASGNVYVADMYNHRVQKFSSSGVYVSQFGSYGSGNGQFIYPMGVAVDGSGNVYVADMLNDRIQKFSTSGAYISQFGSYGPDNGQFERPTGIAIDRSGNVYVAGCDSRVQKFSSSGSYLAKWTTPTSGGNHFNGVAVDRSGNVYVADGTNNRVQKFSSSGSLLTNWGSSGSGNGQFDSPSGVAVDGSGNVYVADANNNRIQYFADLSYSTITFTTSGISTDTSGTVLTIDGSPYSYDQIAGLSFSWVVGSTHTITAASPVDVSDGTKQYIFSSWSTGLSGASGTFTTPSSDTTVTVTYTPQYKITFTASGGNVLTDSTGTIVTVAGVAKTRSDLPFTDWYNSGASISWAYSSPVNGPSNNYWCSTSGLGTSGQFGSLSVTSAGEVTGTYATRINQPITLTMANGAPSATVTITGGNPSLSTFQADGTEHAITMDPGASFTLSFSNSGNTRNGFNVGGSFSEVSSYTSSTSAISVTA